VKSKTLGQGENVELDVWLTVENATAYGLKEELRFPWLN
jgi:hypothetical protein